MMIDKLSNKTHLGRPRDEAARAARRQQILDGARACFVQKGFHASSIAMISEEADVSVANIYQYFETKDDLIVALVEEEAKNDLNVIRLIEEASNLRDGLKAAASHLVGADMQGGMQLRLEVLAESFRNPVVADVVKRGDKHVATLLAKVLRAAQARGEMRRDLDPLRCASFFSALCDGILSHLPTSTEPIDELAAEALKALDTYLGLVRPTKRS
jgi:AcrR family transcriptional regulator